MKIPRRVGEGCNSDRPGGPTRGYDGGKTFFITTNEMIPAVWLNPEARVAGRPTTHRVAQHPARCEEEDLGAGDGAGRRWIGSRGQAGCAEIRSQAPHAVALQRAEPLLLRRARPPRGRGAGPRDRPQLVPRGGRQGRGPRSVRSLRDQVSERPPSAAYQAVRYRGLWFYIDDDDFESNASFNALYDLWQLSIKSPGPEIRPVTTIQVN